MNKIKHEHDQVLPPTEPFIATMNQQASLLVDNLKDSAELSRANADRLASEATDALIEYDRLQSLVEHLSQQLATLRDTLDQAKSV